MTAHDRNHPDTTSGGHLDANDLAALADGGAGEAASAAAQAHLAVCRSCMAAYGEAVRVAHRRATQPEAFALPAEYLAAGLAAGSPPRRAATTGRPRTTHWRPAAAVSLAAAAIALAVVFAPGRNAGDLGRGDIVLIGDLLRAQSSAGPLAPDAEPRPGVAAPVYRSGQSLPPDLEEALQAAARKHGSAPTDPRQAYWLAAGYLAGGKVGAAVDLLRVARQRHPEDQRLLVLDGIAAYRASELARAEGLLREAVRRLPDDAVARFDLAVVLEEAGRVWEARQVLAAGDWPAGSEIGRRAAAMADSLP